MGRLAGLLAALIIAAGLFWMATRPPSAPAAAPPATAFSAERAMADVRIIAQRPHPIGSPANQAVRDHLVRRLSAMGLETHVQRTRVVRPLRDRAYIAVATVENVVAVLPGRQRGLPALALTAHYDSVPGSPGAGDDAAGVASALEIVRALKARGQPLRDVVVILTDGEEAGLLGAQAFFDQDPAAQRIGFVINLEGRGSAGRALMFETSEGAAGAVALFAETASAPRSFSVFPLVFRYLPNDSDFSVARRAGAQGLNFSFIGREVDYHTASATVARLDAGAVRSLGGQAFAVAERLAFGPRWPVAGSRRVYGDVLGLRVVHYSIGVGWLVLAAAAGVVALAIRRAGGAISWRSAAAGAVASLYALLLASALVNLARRAAVDPALGRAALLPRFEIFEALASALALGGAVLAASAVAEGRRWRLFAGLGVGAGAAASLFGGFDVMGLALGAGAGVCALAFRRAAEAGSAWAGALVLALLLGALAQIAAPEAAPLIVWPTLAAGAGAVLIALGAETRRWLWAVFIGLAGAALAWIAVILQLSAQALDFAPLIGLTAWLGCLILFPLASGPAAVRALQAGAALVAMGLLAAVALRLTPPWSAAVPREVAVRHITETTTGQAWRVAYRAPAAWTRSVLTAEGGALERRRFAPLSGRLAYAARARPLAVPLGRVGIETRQAGGKAGLRITAPPGARVVWLRVLPQGSARPGRGSVDGQPVSNLYGDVVWTAPDGRPMELTFDAPPAGGVTVEWAALADAWPAGAPPLPRPPADLLLTTREANQVTTGRTTARWPRQEQTP